MVQLKWIACVMTLAMIDGTLGHSMAKYPPIRGNLKWWGICARGDGCNTACEAPKADSQINKPWAQTVVIKRGEKLPVKWSRFNHPGGYVRLAIVPFEKSDSIEEFNKNVVKFSCYESNCGESSPLAMLGTKNGPGMDDCSTSLTIPSNLPDGDYTLQWVWKNGGIFKAEVNTSFGEYYSCSDFKIQGGAPVTNTPTVPTFQGGDAGNPDKNQCRYWGDYKIGQCANGWENHESCGRVPETSGIPAEVQDYLKLGAQLEPASFKL